MNNYRVDVSKNPITTPVGMNSLLYIGDNWKRANLIFDRTTPGFDDWHQPNSLYGVILSVWNPKKASYVVKRQKGFE